MTARTLADPMFASIFNTEVAPYDADEVRQALINHGRKIMNENQINCQTTDEHNHTPTSSTTPVSTTAPSASTTLITSCGELPHNPTQPIQGVTGASYAPMDTSPQGQQTTKLETLMAQLTTTLTAIVQELQPNQQTDLEEAVSTALEQAQWFKDRVEESCAEAVSDNDFDYEIGQNIERYMRNSFDANDHYDFDAEVKSRVEDEVESVIDGLVADAVEARLADLLEEKLANANITINF